MKKLENNDLDLSFLDDIFDRNPKENNGSDLDFLGDGLWNHDEDQGHYKSDSDINDN